MREHNPRMVNAFGDVIYSPIDVLSDRGLSDTLHGVFYDICLEIGINLQQYEEMANILWSIKDWPSIASVENHLHQQFNRFIRKEKLTLAFEDRALLLAKQVKPFLIGNSLVDIGCGDGLVARLLHKHAKEILLVDVDNYLDHRVLFPFFLYSEGSSFPLNTPVDTSLLLTVLHHSRDPIHLLRQTRRITLSRLIVIESVFGVKRSRNAPRSYLYNLSVSQQRKYASFIDWFYNRVLHNDVQVPYNYLTSKGWLKIFKRNGWKIVQSIDLGVDQPIVPEHHVLFVLDTK